MPEYLAPGVYVEEVSFRAKAIEGVSTTTTGLIGPTRYGPYTMPSDVITSLADFEQVYGGRQQLNFTLVDPIVDPITGQSEPNLDPTPGQTKPLPPMHNYMWHAVRAFFEEGGQRLYVIRTFKPIVSDPKKDPFPGQAQCALPSPAALHANAAGTIRIAARFPGQMGGMQVTLTLRAGQNILTGVPADPSVPGLNDRDLVSITHAGWSSPLTEQVGRYYIARWAVDPATGQWAWHFEFNPGPVDSPLATPGGAPSWLPLGALNPGTDKVRIVTLTVTAQPLDSTSTSQVWSSIPLDPQHTQGDTPDNLFNQFAATFTSPDLSRSIPLIFAAGDNSALPNGQINTGVDVLEILFQAAQTQGVDVRGKLDDPTSTDADRSFRVLLTGGNDGQRPTFAEYEGLADPSIVYKTGLAAFEDIDDIAIVAAPGSTYGLERDYTLDARTIMSDLILHAEKMKYRIAVLDSGDGESVSAVRSLRAKFDSTYAALYYPWVRILDPLTDTEITVPPSGFVCGIYARNDVNRGVYKAPANEVVNLALGFELMLNKGQQEVLNPEGINCFRYFEDRGYRLWGARLISSDPEWKYVNLRRYFAYLEHSIDKGTQFAVFEPNGPVLWATIRRAIEDFLLNEWQSGALLGDKPEDAYFVRCDRSTMTQNDLDNGRMVCLIGVAPVYPAEFVIFRIGQFTAGSNI
jgi:phage tail sheath protein FI